MAISNSTRTKSGIPLLGYGTYQLSNDEAECCVKDALLAGFRHIDSAEAYQNEQGTGRGIEASGIPREEIFVTTKLFPGYHEWGSEEKTYQDTIDTLKRQLSELKLDYIDLYLIHAPFSAMRLEQWDACTELKKMGLAKHIGVSNYNIARIREITDAGLPLPDANQIEFHPLCAQPELTNFMEQQAIEPIAYSSLAPLATWRMEDGQGGETLAETKVHAQSVIQSIAQKYKVPDARILLRWGMQRGYCVLTKSSKPERIRDNLNVFQFEIADEDMERLNQLNQNQAIAWAANGLNPMEVAASLK